MLNSTNAGTLLPTLLVMRPSRMREILSALLASLPHVQLLAPADDASQALEQLQAAAPSVVLIDWDLTEQSALEVLRTVKAERPDVRCVMLVNSYHAELMARSARADAVLFKGFSVNELMGVMSLLWNDRSAL